VAAVELPCLKKSSTNIGDGTYVTNVVGQLEATKMEENAVKIAIVILIVLTDVVATIYYGVESKLNRKSYKRKTKCA